MGGSWVGRKCASGVSFSFYLAFSCSNTLFLSLTKGRCSIFPFLYSRSIDQTVIIAFTIFSLIYRSLSRRNVIGSYIWNHRHGGRSFFWAILFSILFVRRST